MSAGGGEQEQEEQGLLSCRERTRRSESASCARS
jgi:hypothetical protein